LDWFHRNLTRSGGILTAIKVTKYYLDLDIIRQHSVIEVGIRTEGWLGVRKVG